MESWKRLILVASDIKPVKKLVEEICDVAGKMQMRNQVMVNTYGIGSIFSVSTCNERFISYLDTHKGCKVLYSLSLPSRPY